MSLMDKFLPCPVFCRYSFICKCNLKNCCALVVAMTVLNKLLLPITGTLVTVIHVEAGSTSVVSSTNPAVFVGHDSVAWNGEDWVTLSSGNPMGVDANETVNKAGMVSPSSWVCVTQVTPPFVVH